MAWLIWVRCVVIENGLPRDRLDCGTGQRVMGDSV